MILSVVIVSYNVKYFLEQCLSSLKKAIDHTISPQETEVFIVDNASSDQTVGFLSPLFPDYLFIQNSENAGFAKANNQALRRCRGDLVLFLNPDTILSEDSLVRCISLFHSRPDAGAAGVHMIDGAGHYLKESKRGFPSFKASFFKMSGLSGIFPESNIFSAYYLGHLSKDQTNPVDILSGAFMMVRKSVLDITGGFDEQFFMYAEDIDLSFRITQAGYKNYYIADATIIHFKGESTRKDFRYVRMFYSAMELFMKKHFRGSRSNMHLYSVRLGLWIRQGLATLRIPFGQRRLSGVNRGPIILKGDAEGIRSIENKLAGRSEAGRKGGSAGEIIYCEGPGCSWQSIIDNIKSSGAMHGFKFHGSGTHAVVGSSASHYQGEVIEL